MDELKLVKILLISILLQIVLVAPRVLIWVIEAIESVLRILKETINSLIVNLKKEALNQ